MGKPNVNPWEQLTAAQRKDRIDKMLAARRATKEAKKAELSAARLSKNDEEFYALMKAGKISHPEGGGVNGKGRGVTVLEYQPPATVPVPVDLLVAIIRRLVG